MLRFWLPYNEDGRMVGLSPTTATSYSSASIIDWSPTGGKCAIGVKIFHTATEEFGNSWTIATWVNSAGWSQYNDIISCKNSSASTYCQWYFSIVNAKTFNLGINGGSSTVSVAYNFSANTWYHVAATYDGDNGGKYGMYINGECVKSGTVVTTMLTGCSNVGVVTRSNNDAGTSPTGGSSKTSDFRIYDHALKDWEIKKIYNAKTFEMEGGLHIPSASNLIQDYDTSFESYNNGATTLFSNQMNSGTIEIVSNINGHSKCLHIKSNGGNNRCYRYYSITAGTYTLSMDYYATVEGKQPFNIELNGGGYTWNSNNSYYVSSKIGNWKRVSMLITTTATTTLYIFFKCETTYDAYFDNIQLEVGSEATPYTKANRDVWSTDSSCNKIESQPFNIIKSGSSINFNGTDSAINIPIAETITGGTWSINIWFYRPNGEWGTKAWETLIGGPSGFELSSKNGGTNTPQIRTYSWTNSGYTYECDKWNMVTLTRTPSGSKCYINGVLKHNGTAGAVPNNNYFIGAWASSVQQNFKGYIRRLTVYKKELSQEDIKNLYIHNE